MVGLLHDFGAKIREFEKIHGFIIYADYDLLQK